MSASNTGRLRLSSSGSPAPTHPLADAALGFGGGGSKPLRREAVRDLLRPIQQRRPGGGP